MPEPVIVKDSAPATTPLVVPATLRLLLLVVIVGICPLAITKVPPILNGLLTTAVKLIVLLSKITLLKFLPTPVPPDVMV